MALEADGRRGWTIGLGHRQPLNYPFELRYSRAEAKRLGQPAAVTGTITTPWRAVMCGPDAHTIEVPLSFLGDGPYETSLLRDNPENAAAVVCEEKTVRREESLIIGMVDGGGFIGRFTRK